MRRTSGAHSLILRSISDFCADVYMPPPVSGTSRLHSAWHGSRRYACCEQCKGATHRRPCVRKLYGSGARTCGTQAGFIRNVTAVLELSRQKSPRRIGDVPIGDQRIGFGWSAVDDKAE